MMFPSTVIPLLCLAMCLPAVTSLGQTPVLEVPNGGYLCDNQPFVLELNFSGGGPYTFRFTIDGVAQSPVTTSVENFVLSLTSAEYQDSVVITGVSNDAGPGTISGMPFVKVVESLQGSTLAIDCNDNDQTYTVSFELSGGVFAYVPVDPASGFINGNQFSSVPIPFAEDYFFRITSGLGCDTLTMAGTPDCSDGCQGFSVTSGSNSPLCSGETILLTAEGATTYVWTGPSGFTSGQQNLTIQNAAPRYAGIYRLTATDGSACTDTVELEVMISDPPTIDSVSHTPLSCDMETVTATIHASGTGQLEYSINNLGFSDNNIFPDLPKIGFDLKVRDQNGCLDSTSVSFVPPDGPVIAKVETIPAPCGESGGTIVIHADGESLPLEYSIDDGLTFQAGHVFDSLDNGVYPIVVRDQGQCEAIEEVILTSSADPPVIDEVVIEQMACEADQNSIKIRVVSASNRLSYSINGEDFQENSRFSNLSPGVYSVTVKDESGCMVTEAITIPSIDVLIIEDLDVRPADCRGNSGRIAVTTRGGSGLLTYLLNDTLQQFNPVFENLAPGNYSLTVTDVSGCSLSREASVSRGECPIYISNAFSPNEDGVNDFFAIFAAGGISGNIRIYRIFDRWGALIYEADNIPLDSSDRWWDGTYRGKPVNPGVYIYHLLIELDGGERIEESGEVNLLR